MLAFIKVLIAGLLLHHSLHALQIAFAIYVPAMAVFGILLYFLRIRKLPWRNQVLALTIASIYITPFSGDGTLIHLYGGFALCTFLALDAWKRQISVPGLRRMYICFALLFSIESFFVFYGRRFEGQFKCLVMGVLLWNALRYPLGPPPEREDAHDLSTPDASLVSTTEPLPEI